MKKNALLVLEDGTCFYGTSIGAYGIAVGEVVFNTAMTGYQEILTDPSYSRQIVTLTYPHIGNTGVNHQDVESKKIHAQSLIIRDLPLLTSNFRSKTSLSDYLKLNNIVAISDIDTRKLTRILRTTGAQNGCVIAGADIDEKLALQKAQEFSGLNGLDLAKEVTTKDQYEWTEGTFNIIDTEKSTHNKLKAKFNVVVYDFGVKTNILRMLADRGCHLTVVPATTSANEVIALKPDGIFLSNGPGDPAACSYAIAATKEILKTNIPLFGICLGHQILALASGATTFKMKFGHHGANHPVQDLATAKVMITSQNHGFAVSEEALPKCLDITHKSLFDKSIQGIKRVDKPAFSFQGHPEASPGPHDAALLFDDFIKLMTIYCAQGSK